MKGQWRLHLRFSQSAYVSGNGMIYIGTNLGPGCIVIIGRDTNNLPLHTDCTVSLSFRIRMALNYHPNSYVPNKYFSEETIGSNVYFKAKTIVFLD